MAIPTTACTNATDPSVRFDYWDREESVAATFEHRAVDHAEKARWHERRWFCLKRMAAAAAELAERLEASR